MQDSSVVSNLVLFVALPIRIALDVAGLVNPKLSFDIANALLFGIVAIIIFFEGQLNGFAFLALCISVWYCVRVARKRKAAGIDPGNATPHA